MECDLIWGWRKGSVQLHPHVHFHTGGLQAAESSPGIVFFGGTRPNF